MDIAGKTCLLTGGAGLIGSHVADALVREGAGRIIIYDDFSRGTVENIRDAVSSGRVEVVRADILDRDRLARAMTGVDIVFHLAAIRITRCAQEPRTAHEILGTGTLNVFEAAVNAGVKRVVASSSASVYGMADSFPTSERHHPYNNDTLYGALKVYLEGMARSFHAMYGMNYVALRYFNVYGPRMDTEGKYTEVMIRWMERCSRGEAPLIFGDGSQTMDFVYVGDIARANILAAKADVCDRVYNVASGTETSLAELATMISANFPGRKAPEFGPERSVNSVRRRLADTEAAKRDLGFTAQVRIEEGLAELVSWWKSSRK
jgi:UDP-glucose 4-epimerase